MTRDYLQEMRETYQQATQTLDPSKKKIAFSICPTTYKQPCRLCDLCKEILWHKDKYNIDLVERAGDMNRKDKFYANIVLPTNPSEVVVFEYGITIGSKLITMEMDDTSDLRGFMDPTTGRNLYVVKYPNPDKRKTKYDVEPRVAITAIPDRGVLNKLYDLDNILNLVKEGTVQPLYQSKLAPGKTEIRVLPSWLGPQYMSVFQVRYRLHYHTSSDELNAIEKGAYNPFSSDLPPVDLTTTDPHLPPLPKTQESAGGWGVKQSAGPTTIPLQAQAPKGTPPGCFETYDPDEEECNVLCKEDGWMEKCKEITESTMQKRRQARGLYR